MPLNIILLTLVESAPVQSTLPIGERMLIGLEVTGIGFLTVFSVLALIWGILMLFRRVFTMRTGKLKSAPQESDVAASQPDAALVAAVIASIAEHEGKSPSQLRVVKFNRK